MKVLWISAGIIALTEICFGIPNDGYHKHVPSLNIIAVHEVAKKTAIMQGPVGPEFNLVALVLVNLEQNSSDSFEKTAYDILYRKKDKNETYIAACCRGTEASRFTAQRLVEHGVGSGEDRAIALEWAANSGHEEALLFLLNPEQEVLSTEVVQAKDNVLLRMAALHGLTKAVQALLDHLSAWRNFNAVHAEQDAALRNAASRGFGEIVKMLVKHGANINESDDYVLRIMVPRGDADMVEFLLKNGANAAALDNESLKVVAEQLVRDDIENSEMVDYAKIFELLKQYGARVTQ